MYDKQIWLLFVLLIVTAILKTVRTQKSFGAHDIRQAAKCAELDARTFACCMQDAKQRFVSCMWFPTVKMLSTNFSNTTGNDHIIYIVLVNFEFRRTHYELCHKLLSSD